MAGVDLIHPRCLVKDFGVSAFYLYRISTLCFVLLLLVGATLVQCCLFTRRIIRRLPSHPGIPTPRDRVGLGCIATLGKTHRHIRQDASPH